MQKEEIINKEDKSGTPKKRPFVNNSCIGCGACVAICSKAFDFTDEGLSKAIKLDSYEGIGVEDAISACPVDAIKWI